MKLEGSRGWLASADRALGLATDRIRLIRAVTPVNVREELGRLEQAFAQGAPRPPRWSYERRPIEVELPRALETRARFVEGEGPLGARYAERARELSLEAEIIDSIATPRLCKLAVRRFLGGAP